MVAEILATLGVVSEDVKEDVWEEHVQLAKTQQDAEELTFVWLEEDLFLEELAEDQQEDQSKDLVLDVQLPLVTYPNLNSIASPLPVPNASPEKPPGEDKLWNLVLVETDVFQVANSEDVKEDAWEEHVQLVKTLKDAQESTLEHSEDADIQEFFLSNKEPFFA